MQLPSREKARQAYDRALLDREAPTESPSGSSFLGFHNLSREELVERVRTLEASASPRHPPMEKPTPGGSALIPVSPRPSPFLPSPGGHVLSLGSEREEEDLFPPSGVITGRDSFSSHVTSTPAREFDAASSGIPELELLALALGSKNPTPPSRSSSFQVRDNTVEAETHSSDSEDSSSESEREENESSSSSDSDKGNEDRRKGLVRSKSPFREHELSKSPTGVFEAIPLSDVVPRVDPRLAKLANLPQVDQEGETPFPCSSSFVEEHQPLSEVDLELGLAFEEASFPLPVPMVEWRIAAFPSCYKEDDGSFRIRNHKMREGTSLRVPADLLEVRESGANCIIALTSKGRRSARLVETFELLPPLREGDRFLEIEAKKRIKKNILTFLVAESSFPNHLGGWKPNEDNSGVVVKQIPAGLRDSIEGKTSPRAKAAPPAFSLEGASASFSEGYHKAVYKAHSYEEFLG